MVTLMNGIGERIFQILQGLYDTQPEARMLLSKLVSQGLTHDEVDTVYKLQRVPAYATARNDNRVRLVSGPY